MLFSFFINYAVSLFQFLYYYCLILELHSLQNYQLIVPKKNETQK